MQLRRSPPQTIATEQQEEASSSSRESAANAPSLLLSRISQSTPPGTPISLQYDSWSDNGFQSSSGDCEEHHRRVYQPASLQDLVFPSIVVEKQEDDYRLVRRALNVQLLSNDSFTQQHDQLISIVADVQQSPADNTQVRLIRNTRNSTDFLHDIQDAFEQLDSALSRDYTPESADIFWRLFDLIWYATTEVDLVLFTISHDHFEQDLATFCQLSRYLPTLPIIELAEDADRLFNELESRDVQNLSPSHIWCLNDCHDIGAWLTSNILRQSTLERGYECFAEWRLLQSIPGSLSSSVVFDKQDNENDQPNNEQEVTWSAADPLAKNQSLFSLGLDLIRCLNRDKHPASLFTLAVVSTTAAAFGWLLTAGFAAFVPSLETLFKPEITIWPDASLLYL